MTGPRREAAPAGGTTTPFVRWTSGAFRYPGATGHDRHAQDVRPVDGRDRDLRAVAGGRRLRARRHGQPGRPGQAALRHHPAAAQRDRRAAPGPCPADGGGGRADPPGPHERPPDAVAAGRGPRLDRRPGGPATGSWPRKARAARRSAGSATWTACGAFVATTRPIMRGQLERVGGSLDWGRERFTMDDGSARAVRIAFKRLYDDGLAYRTEALVNWCPGCRTSVSDLEVIATPETGTLWTIRYHLVGAGRPAGPGRGHRRRHDAAGDDPGRHGRRRPPRRRPLRRARRAPGAHPLRRPRRARHRRRRGRPRLRHGRRQGHARPTTRRTSRSARATACRGSPS